MPIPSLRQVLRLVPRVTLAWAGIAAAVLLLHPHLTGVVHVASTSLQNLAHHPVLSIALSLVTLAHGWGEWGTWVALSIVWVLAEAHLGWRRALVAFGAGHLLATLGVAVLETVAVLTRLAPLSVVRINDDVGASYGFLALAAAGLTVGLRRSRWWLAAVPALLAVSLVDVEWWTIAGHAMAIGVGVGIASWRSGERLTGDESDHGGGEAVDVLHDPGVGGVGLDHQA